MLLEGKHGLLLGVANKHSIAWGCAKAYKAAGADLTLTYQPGKTYEYVAPLAEQLEAELKALDVRAQDQWDQLFADIERLDFALHSIAFAPRDDLHGPVVNCSSKGFMTAMEISCYSFIELARRCASNMDNGGSLVTMSYYGAQRVLPNYHLMGPVKAALEAVVRELSHDLGEQLIRVNAISAGPIQTRAASGLAHFDALMRQAAERAPLHQLTTIDDVGGVAAFLASDAARHLTGQTLFVDAGYNTAG